MSVQARITLRQKLLTLVGLMLLLASAPALASGPVMLTASDAAANDLLGNSVSISGDTMIVGASFDDDVAGIDQGAAYIYRWAGTTWTQEAKLTASDAAAFDNFGFSVSISGNTAIVGAIAADASVADTGSAYIFTRTGTTWTQQAKLTASDAAVGDNFGWSVSLSSNSVIVAAYLDDGGVGIDQGSAYVFTRTGSTWTQQAKLTASDAAANDKLGFSVSIDGDTAIAGAIGHSGTALFGGAAYIFTRAGSVWTQQAILTSLDVALGDQFGNSVSLSGDTAIIGAQFDDGVIGSNQGSAYVFTRTGSTWTQQDMLTAADAAASDFFGTSVSLSGNTAIVGARFDDGGAGNDQGSAYVFTRTGTTWTQQTILTAPGAAAGDQFGVSVALSSDTAIIGAWFDDGPAGIDQGSVHIFERIGGFWIGPDYKVVASDAAAADFFGYAVSIDGDTAIIGAHFEDDAGTDSGSVYVFTRTGSTWTQQAKLTASDAAADDRFGFTVSISGDTAIAGAATNDDAGSNSGSAYIFTRTGTVWTQQAKLTASDAAAFDLFGWSVSLSGNTAIVGALFDDGVGGVDQGAAYIFTRAGTTWTQQAKLTASDADVSDQFGISVALSSDTAIVGANKDDGAAGTNQGSAYVFTRTGTTWTQHAKLTALDAVSLAQFGFSVSIDADTAIIGAHFDNVAGIDTGSAYIFTRTGTTWSQQAKLASLDINSADQFGLSVSISGNTAIVSSPSDSDAGSLSGSAYIFTRTGATWRQQAKLTALDAAASDVFGNSVSVSGDTAIVGAYLDDDAGLNSGSAWFFNVGEECLPVLVHNTSADTVHQLLSDAFAIATPFDLMSATPPAFWSEPIIDSVLTPVVVVSTGAIRLPFSSTLTISGSSLLASSPGRDVVLYAPTTVELNASLLSGANLRIHDSLALQGGNLQAVTTDIQGTLSGFGGVNSDIVNQGNVTIQADTQVVGNYTNSATTTIQNGTLTILGTLTDNGTIVGDFFVGTRAAPGGLFIEKDYSASTDSQLSLLNGIAKFGMNADIAINDNTRFDMATSELRMVGLAGTTQTIEVMSIDIGNSPDGLDRTLTGHYPIGTLKIGPTPTTVNLIDTHDNDNQGQSLKEALYVTNLIIDAGATLNTNGCTIYYSTLTNNGSVDTPSNLVQIVACIADLTGDGFVNGADLGFLLGSWAQPGVTDFNGDGTTDGADLGLLLGAWGACP